VFGFNENKDKVCIDKIVKFCNEKLNVEIVNGQIDRADRVGKPNGNKPRAIIVRFKAHTDKLAVLHRRRTLVGTYFYINEDLTKYNQKLLLKAKKDSLNVNSTWSSDGKIFVKRSSNERRLRIVTIRNFQLALDNIRLLPRKYNLVILGDLNSHYDNTNPHESTTAGLKFNSFLIGNNLTQLVNEPTRITRHQAAILDFRCFDYKLSKYRG
jgi:hypothetical protein